MYYEYAIEPDVLSKRFLCEYFSESFGAHTGRLISNYPPHWAKMVHKAASIRSPLDQKRIVEKLALICQSKLLATTRMYSEDKTWIENAESSHAVEPFHAIIANDNFTKSPITIDAKDFPFGHPLWNVPPMTAVASNASALARAVSRLLHISSQIIFVDAYFHPGEDRYCKSLEALISEAFQGRTVQRFEYHLKFDARYRKEIPNFKPECDKQIAALLPYGKKLTFVRWKKHPIGKRFHARYILTEKGGIMLDPGLDVDQSNNNQKTDMILLPIAKLQETLKEFPETRRLNDPTSVYDYIDEHSVYGTKII